MKRRFSRSKYYALIKDKWLNETKTVAVTTCEGIYEAHKYVYYNHTTNLQDIVRMKDRHGNTVYTLQRGFIH
jgi:hypothetical protein